MTEELERRWDDAVETAWREFRQRLADRLAAVEEDEVVLVRVEGEPDGGVSPYCQAVGGGGLLRVEVVSNLYLAPAQRLDCAQDGALKAIGFAEPETESWQEGATNYWIDLDEREADRGAVMMVRALREVFAVVHPSYVEAEGLEPRRLRPIPPKPRPDLPVSPDGPDEVRRAVDLAVAGVFEEGAQWDDDGDLVVPTKRGLVWVSVAATSPRVLIHAPLVDEVVDEARALVEVNLLNQREFGLTFALQEGRIRVMREVDVHIVVPAQLRLEVERVVEQVDRWATDLATRVGGRCLDEQSARQPADLRSDKPSQGRFATAYAVMVELEREQRGSVTPATMARIFDNDTGLLLKAIRLNEQRRREMRRKAREARGQGRARAEQVARARQEYLRDLTSRMRAGLRLLVDAPVRRVQLDQLALFDEDDCGTGRPA